jgi:hypothetical protein
MFIGDELRQASKTLTGVHGFKRLYFYVFMSNVTAKAKLEPGGRRRGQRDFQGGAWRHRPADRQLEPVHKPVDDQGAQYVKRGHKFVEQRKGQPGVVQDGRGGEIVACFFKDLAEKFYPLLEVNQV